MSRHESTAPVNLESAVGSEYTGQETTASNEQKFYSVLEIGAHYWPRKPRPKNHSDEQDASTHDGQKEEQVIQDAQSTPPVNEPSELEATEQVLEPNAKLVAPDDHITPGIDVSHGHIEASSADKGPEEEAGKLNADSKPPEKTRGTLGNSRDEPNRVAYILLFHGAHPRWESDGIIYCHSSLHLLPETASSNATTASDSNNSAISIATNKNGLSLLEVVEQQMSEMTHGVRLDLETELTPAPETVPAPEATLVETSSDDPRSANIAVFIQTERSFDKAVRNMYFAGYYKITHLQRLAPESKELIRMLEEKWGFAPSPNQDNERSVTKWKDSLSSEWVVVKLAVDENAEELPAPDIPERDFKPRGGWQGGRRGRGGRGGWRGQGRGGYTPYAQGPWGGRGGWRGQGRGGRGGGGHSAESHVQGANETLHHPSTGTSITPAETAADGAFEGTKGNDYGWGYQAQIFGQAGERNHRGQWGRGRGGRYRANRSENKTVNELLAEARGIATETLPAGADSTVDKGKQEEKPLTSHQLRNEDAVSTHNAWNEYAKNVRDHDEKLMQDPKGEVEKWHAGSSSVAKPSAGA